MKITTTKPKETIDLIGGYVASIKPVKVTCDHCKAEVPIEKAHKTEWKEFGLEWYYCDFCENNVFGKTKLLVSKTGKGRSRYYD
jgi:hypothetical protein